MDEDEQQFMNFYAIFNSILLLFELALEDFFEKQDIVSDNLQKASNQFINFAKQVAANVEERDRGLENDWTQINCLLDQQLQEQRKLNKARRKMKSLQNIVLNLGKKESLFRKIGNRHRKNAKDAEHRRKTKSVTQVKCLWLTAVGGLLLTTLSHPFAMCTMGFALLVVGGGTFLCLELKKSEISRQAERYERDAAEYFDKSQTCVNEHKESLHWYNVMMREVETLRDRKEKTESEILTKRIMFFEKRGNLEKLKELACKLETVATRARKANEYRESICKCNVSILQDPMLKLLSETFYAVSSVTGLNGGLETRWGTLIRTAMERPDEATIYRQGEQLDELE